MAGQDFVLDFKFGGNAEFLARLESLMRRVDSMFDATAEDIKDTTTATNELNKAAKNATPGIEKMSGGLSHLASALKSVVAGYAGFQGLQKLWSFGNGSIDLYNQQFRQERQLETVLKNKGMGDEFNDIKQHAANIQGRTIYGDEAMIAGAGELATYVSSASSMKRMMDLLTNYAAGMTGGGEVTPQQMVDLATGLGKAFDGTYEAMRKKGFDTSELEKIAKAEEIIEKQSKGEAGKLSADDREALRFFNEMKRQGMTVEDMKITALENSMGDWKGLAEAFANTDEGKIIQIKNTIGDMREDLGKRLLPVVANLMEKVSDNLPKIQKMMDSLGNAFITIGDALASHLGQFMELGSLIADVVSFASEFPTMSGIVVMSVMALGNAFSNAGDGAKKLAADSAEAASEVDKLGMKIDGATVNMGKMLTKSGLLIGGAGVTAGFSAMSMDNSDADNTVGMLKAMGLAAAFGAEKFGAMGAAIGVASVALGGLLSTLYQYIKTSNESGKVIEEIEERDKDMKTVLRFRKEMKEGNAAGSTNYMRALSEFEAKWGSLDGSYLVEGFEGRGISGKALEEAMKKNINVKVGSDNTITQNVTMETSLSEASVVMRTNLREFIQEQLVLDSKSIGAMMSL